MDRYSSFMINNSYDFLTRSLPGFFFISQFLILAFYSESFGELVRSLLNRPAVFIFGFSVLSLLCGMCFENWGSVFEALLRRRVEPKKIENKNKFHEVWDEYLLLDIHGGPVGHRYLRTLVVRLKFSLGMLVASVLLLLAVAFFSEFCFQNFWESVLLVRYLTFLNIIFVCVFFVASIQLYHLTHHVRELVLSGYKKLPRSSQEEKQC